MTPQRQKMRSRSWKGKPHHHTSQRAIQFHAAPVRAPCLHLSLQREVTSASMCSKIAAWCNEIHTHSHTNAILRGAAGRLWWEALWTLSQVLSLIPNRLGVCRTCWMWNCVWTVLNCIQGTNWSVSPVDAADILDTFVAKPMKDLAKQDCFAHEQPAPLSGVNPWQAVWRNNIDDHEEQEFHRPAWKPQLFPVFLPHPCTSSPGHNVFLPYQCQRQITAEPRGQVKLIQSHLSDKMMGAWGSKRNWMGWNRKKKLKKGNTGSSGLPPGVSWFELGQPISTRSRQECRRAEATWPIWVQVGREAKLLMEMTPYWAQLSLLLFFLYHIHLDWCAAEELVFAIS